MNIVESITAADAWMNASLFSMRSDIATTIFLPITWLGEWTTVMIFVLIVAAFLLRSRQRRLILALSISTFGSLGVTYLTKLLIERPRPLDAILLENSSSFPSAHATIAVAFYGFLAYLLIKKISAQGGPAPSRKNKLNRSLIIFSASVLILAIGFSRLYLGVHYLSDVLAGYLVGLAWLIVGITLVARKQSSPAI